MKDSAARWLPIAGLLLLFFCGAAGSQTKGFSFVDNFDASALGLNKKEAYFAKIRLQALDDLIIANREKSEEEKLKVVNEFFNRVPYVSDIVAWGVKDYWARPTEFLARDKGDCEDYVIAKFFTLKQLGVPENRLYFTYVKALKLNQAHMVLTYYENPRSVPLVMDNLNFRILPATERSDLAYVYSFNAASLFLNTQQGRGKTVDQSGSSKNIKWARFLERIEKDGL